MKLCLVIQLFSGSTKNQSQILLQNTAYNVIPIIYMCSHLHMCAYMFNLIFDVWTKRKSVFFFKVHGTYMEGVTIIIEIDSY